MLNFQRIKILVFSFLLLCSISLEAAIVTGFHVEGSSRPLQLVFQFDSKPEHKIFKLTNPERIVLDLKTTSIADGIEFKTNKHSPNKHSPIERIRYANRKDGLLRIVLDTTQKVDVLDQMRNSASGSDLLITLVQNNAGVRSRNVKKSHSKFVNKATQKIQRQTNNQIVDFRDLIIAIDAGHGGKDPGAIGQKGTREKDIVLKISQELNQLLKQEAGYQPYMTRSGDEFIALRERIKRARKKNADLFVSIHADAAENHKANGSSVYVLSKNGATSEAARRLAKRENAVDLLGGVSLKDKEDTLAHVLLDLTQRHTQDVSYSVANSIRGKLGKIGGQHKNRVEKAGFVVLKSPDIPSILVETAFISNAADEKRLKNLKFQKKMARAILAGIKAYFYQHASDNTIVAQLRKREHIIRSGETLSGIASRYKVRTSSLRKFNKLDSDRLRIGQMLRIPVSDT